MKFLFFYSISLYSIFPIFYSTRPDPYIIPPAIQAVKIVISIAICFIERDPIIDGKYLRIDKARAPLNAKEAIVHFLISFSQS